MPNSKDRVRLDVQFELETPKRKCRTVIAAQRCRLVKFYKRARLAVIDVRPKRVNETLASLRAFAFVRKVSEHIARD